MSSGEYYTRTAHTHIIYIIYITHTILNYAAVEESGCGSVGRIVRVRKIELFYDRPVGFAYIILYVLLLL